MKSQQIIQGISLFKEYAEGKQPKQIVAKSQQFVNQLVKVFHWSEMMAVDFANILIQSEYVAYDGIQWLKLTEKGFAVLCEDGPFVLTPDLKQFYDAKWKESSFNHIWTLIGPKLDENPFNVSGPEFYNVAKQYSLNLPPTYNEYLSQRKAQGQGLSRSEWCKELFMNIKDADMVNFLDELSRLIRERQEVSSNEFPEELRNAEESNPNNEILSPSVNNRSPVVQTTLRKPKIFISHNHDDAEYAKQLVNLLSHIGVKYEDIFCSSYPACGVPFGKSFLDAIRGQYDEFDLLVLYIHSPRYYQSPVSMCEMGASWITRKKYFSFLTSDCDFGMLQGVITPQEIAFKPSNKDAKHRLNEFYDEVKDMFNLVPLNLTIWENHRDDFIDNVKRIQYDAN